eukprot:15208174-Alexandrium_andersonii.AAC.1
MSASLVGSEMCIRDSPPPLPEGLPLPRTPPKSASGAHRRWLFEGSGRACLLYTSDAADDM